MDMGPEEGLVGRRGAAGPSDRKAFHFEVDYTLKGRNTALSRIGRIRARMDTGSARGRGLNHPTQWSCISIGELRKTTVSHFQYFPRPAHPDPSL